MSQENSTITVIFVRNPFQPDAREKQYVPYDPQKTASDYLVQIYEQWPDTDFNISVNGHTLDGEEFKSMVLSDGDQVVVYPVVGKGLKDIFRSILTMALTAFVMGPAFLPNAGWARPLLQGTAMYVGGRIINAILPLPKQGANNGQETSQTYGWNGPKPLAIPGTPVGKTFGTVKPALVMLSRHVTTDGDKQYLNILYGAGEGPVDSVTDITIEGNPIANYKDVAVDIRLGTNDQDVIANFSDNYDEQFLNYELNVGGGWTTHTTTGNAGEGLEILIQCPQGLYRVKDDGNLDSTTVKIAAQFRKEGDSVWTDWPLLDDGDYDPLPANAGFSFLWRNALLIAAVQQGKITFSKYNGAIVSSKNTPVLRVYRMDGLPAGRYEVRCKCVEKAGTTNRFSNRVYWSQLSHVIYDDFCRPNKVLVGIKALATDQLSNSDPDVQCIVTRSTVNVWNPYTSQYEAKRASNPYWACYDLIHNCKKLKNIHTGNFEYVVEGNPANRIDYPALAAAAAYADEPLDGGYRFELDLFLDSDISFWDALARIAVVGRGVIIPKGTKYSCICDKPGESVQLFTMGNITQGSFKGKFQSSKDRAQAIEVDFWNMEKDYKQDQAIYYGEDWETDQRIPNPVKVTRYGIRKYKKAYREAVFLYKSNKYLKRTNNWEADVDAIVCQLGDVVDVQHDVPRWGAAGGRIVSATSSTVTLDNTVTLEPGKTYALKIRLANDDRISASVQSVGVLTETNVLAVTTPFSNIPAQYDVFAFGESSKVTKPFKILNIARSGDQKCKITGVEYIEGMYSDDVDIPVVNYSALDRSVEVSALSVSQETFKQKDGTIVSNAYCSCEVPRNVAIKGLIYEYRREDDPTWIPAGPRTTSTSMAVPGVKSLESYVFRVRTVNNVGAMSTGIVSAPIFITGKDLPPSNVASLIVSADPVDRTKITLTWDSVDDLDLRGYRVSEGGTVLTPTPISDTRYVFTALQSRQHNFSVIAVDNSGNLSIIPATRSMAVTVEPPNVVGFTAIPQETDRSQLILNWSAVVAQDLSYYEVRCGNSGWDDAEIIATQLKSTRYLHQLTVEGYKTYMVKAFAVGGYASQSTVSASLQVTLRPSAVTNVVAVQEPRDRSMVKVTWSPSPGKDIAGYELRRGNTGWESGTVINTATDAQYWWYVPESGTYNIMVRAKTVAGYYSNVANVSITAMIEPYDVTGFTAVQSVSDRTKITLMWDMPIALDVDYFVIKKGALWDTGQVVGQRVTGTFYDVIILDETEQNFWIKAVSMAGNESLNPAMITGVFNLNPSPVSNIVLAQGPNDRSILNISWEATPESDLANYEIRVGHVWQDAAVIGKTKELRWAYSPAKTGDVKIMIKAVNAAGYYSDEASANLYCTLEPGNVAGFRVFQNGEKLAFVWNPVADNDVVGYELREGGNYDNGTIVAPGITLTQYQLAVDTEILRKFHVKAINRSGHYSNFPASASVLIADLPPKNVIQAYDEIALQSGTHDGTEFGESLITFATLPGKFSDYPTTRFSDIGGAMVLKLTQVGGVYPASGTYTCTRKDLGQVITANIATVFQPSILYTAGTTAALEYRTSRDATTWTDWQPFSPVESTFRYADFRVLLATQDTTKTPEINQLSVRFDVPDKDLAKSVVVPIDGVTVPYGYTFYELPVVTPTAEGTSRAVWSVKTKSTVKLQVLNSAGADVGGAVDLRVKGY